MTVDPAVIPGLLVLAAELIVLAAVGFVVVRVALRQTDDRMALAQGLVVGPALWGFIASFVLFAIPGRAAGIVAWGVMLLLGAALVFAHARADLAARTHSGGHCHRGAGAFLGRPRQPAAHADS